MLNFSDDVINWQLKHGRHDLPWQVNRTPYGVWVSEIMLQQTQVSTATRYFTRFMTTFPDVASLANSTEDEVLSAWSGLGYYSRAINLIKSARIIAAAQGGIVPSEYDALISLPGIGRSTAGAILALAYGKKYPILDGNVKRVLARVFCVDGPPNASSTMRELWALAEKLMPNTHIDAYTQGLMDIGATVCVRRNPNCLSCPLKQRCLARLEDVVGIYPAANNRQKITKKSIYMIVFVHADTALMVKNSGEGLWPGLLGFIDSEIFSADILDRLASEFKLEVESTAHLAKFRHRLTHIDYLVRPVRVNVSLRRTKLEHSGLKWINLHDQSQLPISVPVKKIFKLLH
ncbi:MAG: A/G-specific adenine glycosylase [Proteobacteria bacterium]|nr:A/G-specific adenine glycosylase [Pseudomonadota bacterium]MDA1332297.1 A/G-specific adenine glycosylase [Pseudomonadota bacterium]